jgi:parallel beta-helix repeat protein
MQLALRMADDVTVVGAGMGKTLEHSPGNAFKTLAVTGMTFKFLEVTWTAMDHTDGAYGVYPVQDTNVLVEDCKTSGASDSGVYIGQSQNIVVRNNEAFQNVAGIEIENSFTADVHDNYAHDKKPHVGRDGLDAARDLQDAHRGRQGGRRDVLRRRPGTPRAVHPRLPHAVDGAGHRDARARTQPGTRRGRAARERLDRVDAGDELPVGVAPPRLEEAETYAPNVAPSSGKDADSATQDDAKQRSVSASATTADDAIRAAVHVAVDVGEYDRARGLLDLLDAKPRGATVTPLAVMREQGRRR